jgi:hypothetical protein
MDGPWNDAKQAKDNVDPKIDAEAFSELDCDGWEKE